MPVAAARDEQRAGIGQVKIAQIDRMPLKNAALVEAISASRRDPASAAIDLPLQPRARKLAI